MIIVPEQILVKRFFLAVFAVAVGTDDAGFSQVLPHIGFLGSFESGRDCSKVFLTDFTILTPLVTFPDLYPFLLFKD